MENSARLGNALSLAPPPNKSQPSQCSSSLSFLPWLPQPSPIPLPDETAVAAAAAEVAVVVVVATEAAPAAAAPPAGVYDACRDVLLYSVPQCCATDVGGVAGLNCANVSELPKSAENFQEICAGSGQQAKCCTLPVLGQALICNTPIGVTA
ncbi:hydrophobin [Apiospora arundinis]